ncbi:hypothetical protein RJI07_06195 [Mycoplasmatota bacterium WC30]
MFVNQIKNAIKYTKQLRTITRKFNSKKVNKGVATLIAVNDEGWLITCKHVALNIVTADKLHGKYLKYKNDCASGQYDISQLNKKYGYKESSICQLKNQFFNVFTGKASGFNVHFHDTLDIALIKIDGDIKMLCSNYPVFSSKNVESGQYLCKLGFPFAEFTCIEYDSAKDDIGFTETGTVQSPYFPLDGMVTRRIADKGKIIGFEMSTPGIKGQSGGPIFDRDNIIWGMQYQTRHLDLDFKMIKKIDRPEGVESSEEYAFMNVGLGISSVELINFMNKFNVKHHSI